MESCLLLCQSLYAQVVRQCVISCQILFDKTLLSLSIAITIEYCCHCLQEQVMLNSGNKSYCNTRLKIKLFVNAQFSYLARFTTLIYIYFFES